MSAPSPFSFKVTTDAEVAVGHIKHNAAASSTTPHLMCGNK
ncbi:hypothetical protein [Prevotellamassilia timonensis]